MARLPLVGGSYSARSIIANGQRCINLFPERNAEGAPVPLTHYQRPGLRAITAPEGNASTVRCLYRASNGNGYVVVGNYVYSIDGSWNLTLLGGMAVGGSNPCSMIDNGTDLMLVDGSAYGYNIELATNVMTLISDSTGTFQGADRVDYCDGFLVWNMPGTKNFGSTLYGTPITFDALYFAGKTGYPDLLQTLIVNRHEIYLVGTLKSEAWYDAGLSTFPFAQLPGAFFEHGTIAKYSIAMMDTSVFLLGQDLQGQGIVYRIRGYEVLRISNFALEYQIRLMEKTVGISDAIGYCYQQDGHAFYVLQFPAGDQTWVFDDSLGNDSNIAWHQECWADGNGALHRHRGNCYAYINGLNVVGDFQNGTIYEMDLDQYVDTVGGSNYPIPRIRTFPHIGTGEMDMGIYGVRPVVASGKRVQYKEFIADIEAGLTAETPQIALRYSDDRGRTWSSDVLQTGGALGEYLTWPTWRGLGIARDRVFELEYSHDGPAALNGAWVDATVLES